MPDETAKAPRVTKEDIERYLQLEKDRLDLNRQARDKGRLAEELEKKLWAWVEAHGGASKCRTHTAGFIVAIKTKAGQVSWADEFVRIAGEAEAQRLRAEAPRKEFLTVEPTR